MIKVEIIEDAPLEVAVIGEIVKGVDSEIERYTGEYTVTPNVTEQTLPTENKYMDGDVTIKAIPYFEVKNTSNGKTVIIGG